MEAATHVPNVRVVKWSLVKVLACFCNSQYLTLGSIILMHSSIPVNIHLIFHDQANQWAPNQSASLSSGKQTGVATSPWSQGCSPQLLLGRFTPVPPASPSSAPLPPLPLQVTLACPQQEADDKSSAVWLFLLPLLRVLQTFSPWFSRTQWSLWKLRAVILMAELLTLLEAMLSSEDGSLLFSASSPATSCGFQLHRAQGSWLFLGCLRSKRKQRLSFLVTLLCLVILHRVGGLLGILHHQLLAKEGTGAVGRSVWALPVPHILPYS